MSWAAVATEHSRLCGAPAESGEAEAKVANVNEGLVMPICPVGDREEPEEMDAAVNPEVNVEDEIDPEVNVEEVPAVKARRAPKAPSQKEIDDLWARPTVLGWANLCPRGHGRSSFHTLYLSLIATPDACHQRPHC